MLNIALLFYCPVEIDLLPLGLPPLAANKIKASIVRELKKVQMELANHVPVKLELTKAEIIHEVWAIINNRLQITPIKRTCL